MGDLPPVTRTPAPPTFPLTTMVLNVTNQCNLSCTYCYEYGEDKIVDTENGKQSKFMNEETARESVEFLLRESGINRLSHLTFFGGETLMNFPVVKSTIAYARQRAGHDGIEPRICHRGLRLRFDARPVSRARGGVSGIRAGEPASRIFQREGHAGRDPQRNEQGLPVRRGARADGRFDGRRRGAVPSLRRVGQSQARDGAGRDRPAGADRISRKAPHRREDRLFAMLGEAVVLGRLLPRGAHALWRHGARQPALLRMDSRLDGDVSENLRGAGGA